MNPEQLRWYINHFGIILMPWLSAGIGVLLISITPIGRAIIDRLRAGGRAQREALRAELEELRQRLGDVNERVDFAERALAQQRATGLPPAPRSNESRVPTPV